MYGYFSEGSYKGDLPYTDLALERRRIEYKREERPSGLSLERIKITTKRAASAIGKPIGLYHTLNMGRADCLSYDVSEQAKDELASELCQIFEESDIFPGRILVVGLGNPRLTPDAIGCVAAEKVKPTMHIKEWSRRSFTALRCAEIGIVKPDVAAASGLDAAVVVKGVCDVIRPDAVIAVDAIATRSAERLGSTIQICNSGISPGSGLGNPKLAIGIETVGVPVIAIGLPTVIDSRVLCGEAKFSSPPMFVSPKEINEIVDCAAAISGGGINRAFGIAV